MRTSRIKGLLVAIVALVFAFTQASNAPTFQEGKDAWEDSSAAQSCGLHQVHDNLANISVNSDGECAINVDCSTAHWGQHRNNNWSGSKTDMGNLSNCNGNLKVGSC